eukprot:8115750-Pyramimonas_sp.AAC.1
MLGSNLAPSERPWCHFGRPTGPLWVGHFGAPLDSRLGGRVSPGQWSGHARGLLRSIYRYT